jgi:hypothetical protein
MEIDWLREPGKIHSLLDRKGFLPLFHFGRSDWMEIPETPGVYVVFDRFEIVYVGMAGRDRKGSLRRRLRDHASGQIVNMFAQYLLFSRILTGPSVPKTPQEATSLCRAYIRHNCAVRTLPLPDGLQARRLEEQLKVSLRPTFNGRKEE